MDGLSRALLHLYTGYPFGCIETAMALREGSSSERSIYKVTFKELEICEGWQYLCRRTSALWA